MSGRLGLRVHLAYALSSRRTPASIRDEEFGTWMVSEVLGVRQTGSVRTPRVCLIEPAYASSYEHREVGTCMDSEVLGVRQTGSAGAPRVCLIEPAYALTLEHWELGT